MKILIYSLLISFFVFAANTVYAQPVIELVNYASGFNRPVAIENAGDSRMFIVEQPGIIRIIDSIGVTQPVPFLDISSRVTFGGEQGLLGLAFHPNFANNGYFYVNYVNSSAGRRTRISRFSVDSINPNVANAASEVILLDFSQPFSNHNGGDITFGPDGYLYIATGDGGSGGDPLNSGQTLSTLLGKILRITVDSGATYSIPPDNPFIADTSAADEIWAYGLRNPWRISFDQLTGDLWIADVGQDVVEEIDVIKSGSTGAENFGWRCYEGNSSYNTSGCLPQAAYEAPVFQYLHVDGLSVTGGYVYRGQSFPFLYGHYIFADYSSGKLWTLYEDSNATTGYTSTNQVENESGISTFGVDVYGEMYAADLHSGIIYHIQEACQDLEPSITSSFDTLMVNFQVAPSVAISYQWYLNGSPVPGAISNLHIAMSNGTYTVEISSANGCIIQSMPFNFTGVHIGNQQTLVQEVQIMPNPVSDIAHVVFTATPGELYAWVLYDLQGKEVRRGSTAGNEFYFRKNDLPSGPYLLEIMGDRSFRKGFLVN